MTGTKKGSTAGITSDGDRPVHYGVLGGTAIKPVERHGWAAIAHFLYDKETGAIFTRTPKSWFQITAFYCIYYTLLAAFWYGMMRIFFLTLPYDQPRWMQEESIIGTDPGLGLRPLLPDKRIDSSLYRLQWDNKKSKQPTGLEGECETDETQDFACRLGKFLAKYKDTAGTIACNSTDNNYRNHPEDHLKPCTFELKTLGECGNFPYGYVMDEGKSQIEACLVFKVNRIFGWEPQPFTDEDLESEETTDMSEELKNKIKKMDVEQRKHLFVDCEGENPPDIEAVKGKLTYFPANQGIPFRYFPYKYAHKNYHSPLIAIKVGNVPRGQLLHIECRLWGKGIKYNRKDRIGMKRFEYLLDGGQLTDD